MEVVFAALTAGAFTFFDLDRTFYVPKRVEGKARLRALWFGFILVNALLAAGLYRLVRHSSELSGLDPNIRAIVTGAAFVGLVRLKLATIPYEGRQIPFGFEILYDLAKTATYRRINRIALDARVTETKDYANSHSLRDLVREARMRVRQDPLLDENEPMRRRLQAWILQTVEEVTAAGGSADDFDARAALADFVLSGQPPHEVRSPRLDEPRAEAGESGK
jgi:hypothetical protein